VATSAATVTVNFAPSIATQPTNQTVTAGTSATFIAAATGNPTPTVQWQVSSDGTNWSNVSTGTGGTTNSYTTAALTSAENGYQYRALYSNSVTANVATNAATVTVNSSPSAPVITLQPVNTGVEAGQTATFTASATGNPAPAVQWQSSTDGSTGWADIGGATSPTLSFTASVGDNGKYYRAVFSNSVSPDATE
ncbi:MAG: immunoglobulin domain-containing protein, partial [Planctomycetota bacterium]|nr:immunoglobulin domain-containing protein [Planctomycetota bacterium]